MPAAARRARPGARSRATGGLALTLFAALACEQGSGSLSMPPVGAPPEITAPRPEQQLRPPGVVALPIVPPSCPEIACEPEGFEVRFERAGPWTPGTYYIRVSADGGPRRVCTVVFEPVLGAAHDTCSDPALPFRVHYRYDEVEQVIAGVSFGQVHAVQLTVLTSEAEPALVQVEHQLQHRYSSVSAACGPCPDGPAPLIVRVGELVDAGVVDAGDHAAVHPADGGDAGREDGGRENDGAPPALTAD